MSDLPFWIPFLFIWWSLFPNDVNADLRNGIHDSQTLLIFSWNSGKLRSVTTFYAWLDARDLDYRMLTHFGTLDRKPYSQWQAGYHASLQRIMQSRTTICIKQTDITSGRFSSRVSKIVLSIICPVSKNKMVSHSIV